MSRASTAGKETERKPSREGKHHDPLLMSPGGTIRQHKQTVGDGNDKDYEAVTSQTDVNPEALKDKPLSLVETIAASLEKLAVATESLNQANTSTCIATPEMNSNVGKDVDQGTTKLPSMTQSQSSPMLPTAPPPTMSVHSSMVNKSTKDPTECTPVFTDQHPLSTPGENYWLAATPSPMSSSSSPCKSMFGVKDGETQQRALFGGAINCVLSEEYLDVSELRQVPDNQEVFMHKKSNSTIVIELLEYQENVQNDQAAQHFFDDLCSANEASKAEILSCRVVKGNERLLPRINNSFPRCILIGKQWVTQINPYHPQLSPSSKTSSNDTNESLSPTTSKTVVEIVNVMMILVRLKSVNTDMMISVSTNNDLNIAAYDDILSCFLPHHEDVVESIFNTNKSNVNTSASADQNIHTINFVEDSSNVEEDDPQVQAHASSPQEGKQQSRSSTPFDHFRIVLESFDITDWSLFV